jgi:hypothetical protein
VLTKAEDRSLYARKVGFSSPRRSSRITKRSRTDIRTKQGREGIVIVKTTQAILIAHYGDGMIAGNSAQTVEQLADYLIETGY